MSSTVVIVGAGQAGYHAAAALRSAGFAGEVELLGDEPGLPYQRPPLSKSYLRGPRSEDIVFRPGTFYAEHGIDVRHQRVAAVDRDRRHVVLDGGEPRPYDHLILATGARARRLPVDGAHLDGVVHLRTREDADHLRSRLAAASEVAIVGAGFIGLELASVAAELGVRATVVELAPGAMMRTVSEPTADFFVEQHEARGVRFRFNTSVRQLVAVGGAVTGLVTDHGDVLEADLVVVGIGVVPNTGLAERAGLPLANGIRVDAHLLTSDPAISAIGDCAAFPSRHGAGLVRLESVQNATDQARYVAERINGRQDPYAAVPWFWSEQAGSKLQIAGLTAGHDACLLRGSVEDGSFSVLCFRGERFLGAESVNRVADHMKVRKLMSRGGTVSRDEAIEPTYEFGIRRDRPIALVAGRQKERA
jgi:3-phenylpropionate/trans-cinnamate dioxygenase ferredoxin reductase component